MTVLLLSLLLSQSMPLDTSAIGGVSLNTQQTVTGAKTFSAALLTTGDLRTTQGQKLTFDGSTGSKYLSSDGTTLTLSGLSFQAPTSIKVLTGSFYVDSPSSTVENTANGHFIFRSSIQSGTAAGAFEFWSNNSLSSASTPVVKWFKDNGSTSIATLANDGYFSSATPHTLMSAYVNALLATGTTYGGHVVNKAFTVTDVTLYVSVGSSTTAANQVITITDGTNTCTATFACNTSTNTTGAKTVATANGSGTGCVYAANAALSFSTTTQGCGTAATVKNIDIVGKWQ